MEKERNCVKKNFVDLFCQVTKMYKDINHEMNKSYLKGRKEAFEEIIQWVNNCYGNGKGVSGNGLSMFLQEKIEKVKNNISVTSGNENGDNEIKQFFQLGVNEEDMMFNSGQNGWGGFGNNENK